jgi:hypothetical protein
MLLADGWLLAFSMWRKPAVQFMIERTVASDEPPFNGVELPYPGTAHIDSQTFV